mgnify:CR=1 FL=1
MIQVKTKHLKNLYDKKRKSLDSYEKKKAFDEHVEIVIGVAMDRIERWQPEEKGDMLDEAVEMVSEALTGDMPDFSAPEEPEEKESPEEGEPEKGDSPEKTKKTRGGKK